MTIEQRDNYEISTQNWSYTFTVKVWTLKLPNNV